MRFYEFQGGRLLIDGRDIRTLDLAQYRRRLGLVPQVPFLFAGRVAENIRYGRPDASDAGCVGCRVQLGGGEWVDDLPQGCRPRSASAARGSRWASASWSRWRVCCCKTRRS